MKTSTKILIAISVLLLLTAVGVAVFMSVQNSGSDFDPILNDAEIGTVSEATPTPEATETPEPTPETKEISPDDTEIIAVERIEGYPNDTGFVNVAVKPVDAGLEYTVTAVDETILSVELNEEESGFDYTLKQPGNTSVNVISSNGKLYRINVVVNTVSTPKPTAAPTYTPTYSTPTYSTPVPTVAPTAVPEQNNDPNAFSDGDLSNYNPNVDSGNVNVCEYTLDGQTYQSEENSIPQGAEIVRCWPK